MYVRAASSDMPRDVDDVLLGVQAVLRRRIGDRESGVHSGLTGVIGRSIRTSHHPSVRPGP